MSDEPPANTEAKPEGGNEPITIRVKDQVSENQIIFYESQDQRS